LGGANGVHVCDDEAYGGGQIFKLLAIAMGGDIQGEHKAHQQRARLGQ
jgi:hypothetical protein